MYTVFIKYMRTDLLTCIFLLRAIAITYFAHIVFCLVPCLKIQRT